MDGRKLSIKGFLLSALFPILIILVAVVMIYQNFYHPNTHVNPLSTELLISVIISLVIGGVLPIILILTLKIDTSRFFLKQLIVYIVSFAAWALPCIFLLLFVLTSGLIVLIPLAELIVTVFVFKKIGCSGREGIVLSLSNPVLHLFLFLIFGLIGGSSK